MTDQSTTNMQQLFNRDVLIEPVKAETGKWMSVQDASNATGLSMGTLRRYVKARKVKSRQLGRSFNSKLELWITTELLPPEEPIQSDHVELDAQIEAEVDYSDHQDFVEPDQTDQSTEDTLAWLRQKLDEKDELIREKDAKIEKLSNELVGATFRNGYLEAEKSGYEQKLLLLEDKSKQSEEPAVTESVSSAPVTLEPPKSGWARFRRWFTGS